MLLRKPGLTGSGGVGEAAQFGEILLLEQAGNSVLICLQSVDIGYRIEFSVRK